MSRALRLKILSVSLLLMVAGFLMGFLVSDIPVGRKVALWTLYGLSIALLLAGSGGIAILLSMRKTGAILLATGFAVLAADVAWSELDKRLRQCEISLSGISVAQPKLVCGAAFAIFAVGAAFVLTLVFLGFINRENVA